MQSIVPRLVREGELSTAIALNSIPMTVGRMFGPAIGAYLAAHLGAAAGFAVSAGLHLVFAMFLVVVRFPAPPERSPDADYRVRAALNYVWRDRPLLLALVAVTTVGFASDPSITLTPSLAEELDGGTQLVGLLSARLRDRRGGRHGGAGDDAGRIAVGAGVVDRTVAARRRMRTAGPRHGDRRRGRRVCGGRPGLRLGDDGPEHGRAGTCPRRIAGTHHGALAGRLRRVATVRRGAARWGGRSVQRAGGVRDRRRSDSGRCAGVPTVESGGPAAGSTPAR